MFKKIQTGKTNKMEEILLVFLFILLILLLILIASKIRIKIDNLQFTSKKIDNSYLNNNYNIKIELIILEILPLIWININKRKIDKLKSKNKININLKNINKKMSKIKISKIKDKINVKIKEFNLKLFLGTDFTIFTSLIIPIFSTLIAILLSKKEVDKSKQNYELKPVYNLGNLVEFEFSGTFEIQIIDIIKMLIYVLNSNQKLSNRINQFSQSYNK